MTKTSDTAYDQYGFRAASPADDVLSLCIIADAFDRSLLDAESLAWFDARVAEIKALPDTTDAETCHAHWMHLWKPYNELGIGLLSKAFDRIIEARSSDRIAASVRARERVETIVHLKSEDEISRDYSDGIGLDGKPLPPGWLSIYFEPQGPEWVAVREQFARYDAAQAQWSKAWWAAENAKGGHV